MKIKLGQHFLIDQEVIKKIIITAELKPSDIVLEIGSGKGALTQELRKQVKKVIAIEKDPELSKKSNAINANILETNFSGFNKVIANIPYYITGKILKKFAGVFSVYLIQKEVADRICNKCKTSILSLSIKNWGKPELIAYVSKNSFDPAPKVDSAIIRIIPRKKELGLDMQLIKKAFSQKRKKLRNTLGINSDKRPENLSLKEWITLSDGIA